MAKSFPQKSSGSEDAARAAAWLADTLRGWGYLVHVQEFRARLGGEVALRNVLAFHPGGSVPAMMRQGPASWRSYPSSR